MTDFSVFYQSSQGTQNAPLCLIQTAKHILSIPLGKILFIESRQKHSILHMKTESIALSMPLYRILEQLPADAFLQTHRSFLVNLNHISHIDKSRDPWTISFIGSDKVAFVSRSFRHQVIHRLTLSD